MGGRRKTGKKPFKIRGFKVGRNLRIWIVVGLVALLGIAAYFFRDNFAADAMTASCAGTKGKCFEESVPVRLDEKSNWKVIVTDKKGVEQKNVQFENLVRAKTCFRKGSPGHPKGGCVPQNLTYGIKKSGDSFGVVLYKFDRTFFKDGKEYKKETLYFPGFDIKIKGQNNDKDVSSMWVYSLFKARNQSGKVVGQVKISAPFEYTTSQSKASKALQKLNNTTKKIVLGSSDVKSTSNNNPNPPSSNSGSGQQTSSKFNLVITRGNGVMQYSYLDSKRCAISVIAYRTSANPGKYEQKEASTSCNGYGGYQNMEIRDIDPSILDGIVLRTSDTGGGNGKRQAVNRIFTKNLKDGTIISQAPSNPIALGGAVRGSNGVTLSCVKGYDTVTCTYNVMLWVYDADK